MKLNFSAVVALTALIMSGLTPALAAEPAAANIIIPVDSPAFYFSPANWVGNEGRAGSEYRQAWNSGAYFRVRWTSSTSSPAATLLLDVSEYDTSYSPPKIAINIDGVWTTGLSCQSEIKIDQLTGSGDHLLTVYMTSSQERDRWGSAGKSGRNIVRVRGLRLDEGNKAGIATSNKKWLLEIGDSITEGIGADAGQADNLSGYSYFVGQAMQDRGFEYAVSACGYSGWLNRGDAPPGDVPGYYIISGSQNGTGGTYDEQISRWNKIDANTSLFDSASHLSGYGGINQEPAIITINYGTNDGLFGSNLSDTQASITQSLVALRKAAPKAEIFIIIPFGQFMVSQLKGGVKAYLEAHPKDKNVTIIDLGPSVAAALDKAGNWGDLHPNMRGHAAFAARIVGAIERKLAA